MTWTEPDGVPALRVRACNAAPVRRARHVLYWMIAARRSGWNFGLERALGWARALERPLLVLEPLRAGYPWASARFHRFVLDGMAENERAFAAGGATYYPYVEPEVGQGRGLLAALAEDACVVVTDDFPCFFLPRMVAAAARALSVRVEAVDSNGLAPLAAHPQAFGTAHAFRRWLQRELVPHLGAAPLPEPLGALGPLAAPAEVPREVERRWPRAASALLSGDAGALARLPVDHGVGVVSTRGGRAAGARALERFVAVRLAHYDELRNHPDEEATSGLSPWLHFGHVSAHEVFAAVTAAEGWTPAHVTARRDGGRGWLGLSPAAEAFVDQLVTWRELGHGFAARRPDHADYEALPDWARATLEAHARTRGETYSLERLERAETGDELWNAAQNELRSEGRLHNYLRMLWGKKILEWSPSPREALARMIHLNDKYALDGRDPNSYCGITWCLGRFDRPWGPKRAVFGTVRYMSSENTARKLRLAQYLERHAPRRPEVELPGAAPAPARQRRRRG